MDRAYVNPDTGHTTGVWQAPTQAAVEALFEQAGVTVASITPVEEFATP